MSAVYACVFVGVCVWAGGVRGGGDGGGGGGGGGGLIWIIGTIYQENSLHIAIGTEI